MVRQHHKRKREPSPESPLITEDKTASSGQSPGHPLYLESYFKRVGPQKWDRVDIKPTNIRTNQEEKDSVREVGKLLLQANRALQLDDPLPEPSEDWDWRSCFLTSNAYGKLIHVVKKHKTLKQVLSLLSYDWIPDKGDRGTIIVRKRCGLQVVFTRQLVEVIQDAVLRADIRDLWWDGLQPQTRASVLVGEKLGMRTPCRCFRFDSEDQEDAHIQGFVLEVGMEEKSKDLPMIAQSYIGRGTLCVLTADIHRSGEYDGFSVAYSLYSRGRKTSPVAEGVTRYEVIERVKDLVPKKVPGDSLNLTLLDFYPAKDLEKHGVGLGDPRARVAISDKVLRKCFKTVEGCIPSISKDMERFERLLEKEC
ncbi:MAG: hypothetical protein Q9188_001283 [Gyalolechia gomerana]